MDKPDSNKVPISTSKTLGYVALNGHWKLWRNEVDLTLRPISNDGLDSLIRACCGFNSVDSGGKLINVDMLLSAIIELSNEIKMLKLINKKR